MDTAAAQREHGHVRIENLETECPQFAVQFLAALHRKDPVIAQGNQVDPQVPRFPVFHLNEFEASGAQPDTKAMWRAD